jgi:hypothetical protein
MRKEEGGGRFMYKVPFTRHEFYIKIMRHGDMKWVSGNLLGFFVVM